MGLSFPVFPSVAVTSTTLFGSSAICQHIPETSNGDIRATLTPLTVEFISLLLNNLGILGKNGRLCFENVLGKGAIRREVGRGSGSDVPIGTLWEGSGRGSGIR